MTAKMGFLFYFWREPKEGFIGLLFPAVAKKKQLLLKESFLRRGEGKWIEPAKIISEQNNPVPSRNSESGKS